MKYKSSDRSFYCYEGTFVLKNNFNILDEKTLENVEMDITMMRLAELEFEPINGKFDLIHLCEIHKYIFGEIYPFAGKTRNEDIIKDHTKFCHFMHINNQFAILFSELRADKHLKGLSIQKTAEKLAYYMGEINFVHPFREGNGRAIREYIRCLALYSGYSIDWSAIDPEEILYATILTVNKEYNQLTNCIEKSMKII